jgi:hypothetical protein
MTNLLINTAELRALVAAKTPMVATARPMQSVEGFLLFLKKGDDAKEDEMVLSTYLSDKPRLFKRADALLKEASNNGLTEVLFELLPKTTPT